MNESSFDIYGRVQKFFIKPLDIKGSYDGIRSYLNIFLYIHCEAPGDIKGFDVISIHAKLKFQNFDMELSSLNIPTDVSILPSDNPDKAKDGAWFKFYLDDKALNVIEAKRNGDLQLRLDFVFSILIKNEIQLSKDLKICSVESVMKKDCTLYFPIVKSHWVENILKELGLPGFKLVEIPLSHKTIDEAYEDIIAEFNQAEKYFKQNDYNKCISHCRHTLDHLSRNLTKIRKNEKSETAFNWLKTIDNETLNWIDAVDKSIKSISNKTHHIGLKKDFNRREAESIYLVTLGLMNFISQYANQE